MKKQACRKCIYWELAINEGITEPYILETDVNLKLIMIILKIQNANI